MKLCIRAMSKAAISAVHVGAWWLLFMVFLLINMMLSFGLSVMLFSRATVISKVLAAALRLIEFTLGQSSVVRVPSRGRPRQQAMRLALRVLHGADRPPFVVDVHEEGVD